MSGSGRLAGKTALITGAAKGIGRAAALRFAHEGARLALVDIDPSGEAVAAAVRAQGGSAAFIAADVTDAQAVEQAMAAAVAELGTLDILYNNAGGSRADDGPITETSLEAFWATINVDLFGTWLFCKYGVPELIKAGGGSIINTSSMMALGTQVGGRAPMAYSAAKGAVASLTRVMAVEYAPKRVRVNALAPGMTLTERIQRRFAGRAPNPTFQARVLLGPMQPDDVVNTALFLASDEAAHITGQVISVDSGISVS